MVLLAWLNFLPKLQPVLQSIICSLTAVAFRVVDAFQRMCNARVPKETTLQVKILFFSLGHVPCITYAISIYNPTISNWMPWANAGTSNRVLTTVNGRVTSPDTEREQAPNASDSRGLSGYPDLNRINRQETASGSYFIFKKTKIYIPSCAGTVMSKVNTSTRNDANERL